MPEIGFFFSQLAFVDCWLYVVPSDQNYASNGPKVDQDDPKGGFKPGSVMICNTNSYGFGCCFAASIC